LATLRLNQEPKPVDDVYFDHEDAEEADYPDFIEFRRQFYKYQYEFISRAEDASNELVSFYKKLAFDENAQEYYGASISGRVLQVRRYHIDLYIDFNLSIRKSKETFEKNCNALWTQIESMFSLMSEDNKDYITDFPKKADGKKAVVYKALFIRWQKALDVFDACESQTNKNISKISRDIKLSNKKMPRHKTKEVNDYREYAIRLIEAAKAGNLFNEVSTPMTVGRKRKTPV